MPGGEGRTDQDQRHAQLLLVQRAAVHHEAVLEERLAVVGGQHDQGVLGQSALVEEREGKLASSASNWRSPESYRSIKRCASSSPHSPSTRPSLYMNSCPPVPSTGPS